MDKHEWQEQARRLNVNFPGQELRPESLIAWYDEAELAEQHSWLVRLAVQRIIRTHRFPPRAVTDLLSVVEEVRGELAREQASDATRTCPGCCTQDVAGWIEVPGILTTYHPCGDCRPGRYQAWELTRQSGWPSSKTGRNYMAAPFDKATGYLKDRSSP
jgi:hypothetical protein